MELRSGFRIPWDLLMIPAVLPFIGLISFSECPRWLAEKGRWKDCLAVLSKVHGRGDLNSSFVRQEYEEIKKTGELERPNADVASVGPLKPEMINRANVALPRYSSGCANMNVKMCHIT
jgi:hypothetical protein